MIFLFIGKFKWCLYKTQSILIGCSTLSQEYCVLAGWDGKIMRRQLWTLTCPIVVTKWWVIKINTFLKVLLYSIWFWSIPELYLFFSLYTQGFTFKFTVHYCCTRPKLLAFMLDSSERSRWHKLQLVIVPAACLSADEKYPHTFLYVLWCWLKIFLLRLLTSFFPANKIRQCTDYWYGTWISYSALNHWVNFVFLKMK